MPVNVGNIIRANDFNTIQSKIEKILGVSSASDPTFGYGQTLLSSPVVALTDTSNPNGDSVTAEQMNNLLNDIKTIYEHQTGTPEPTNLFLVGDIVGSDASGTEMIYNPDDTRSIDNIDTDKGINDLEELSNILTSNRFNIGTTQRDLTLVAQEGRTSAWNNTIDATIQITFQSDENRRHFFNSGGEIRITGNVTNASTQRGLFWNDLLENPGEIHFDHNNTINTGSANGVTFPSGSLGNYQLTGTYQTIFRKDASSGIYSNSYWRIEAREDSGSVITFRIILVNDGPESDTDFGVPGGIDGGIQEDVNADIEFDISTMRANGTVSVPNPSPNIVNSF